MVKVARALIVFVIEVQWVGDGCVEERMFSSQFVQLAVRPVFRGIELHSTNVVYWGEFVAVYIDTANRYC